MRGYSNAMDAMTITITDAPESYDGFGTCTIEYLGARTRRGPLRRVETPERHAEWQRMRYSSGLHVAMTPERFADVGDLVTINE